jgi:hypothetical protein
MAGREAPHRINPNATVLIARKLDMESLALKTN